MIALNPGNQASLASAGEVLTLFLIPIGGGIPAGVLLARTRGFHWPAMLLLYFISDVILACFFEPLMLLTIRAGKQSPWVAKVREAFQKSLKKTTAHYGTHLGPVALIGLSFGVDPMTGRAAAAVSGHGFVTGWMIAITGDLFYFSLLMVSTLFLNNLLGDGTWTTLIIMALMIFAPIGVKRVKVFFTSGPKLPH